MPKELPTLAVLGLSSPADGDWARLRGLQYSSLVKVTVARLLAHVIGALVVIHSYLYVVSPIVLFGWGAALVATLYYGARFDHSLGDSDRRRVGRDEIRNHALSSVLTGLVWVVPIILFVPAGTPIEKMTLWTVLAMLMTGSAIALSSVPLGTLLFSLVTAGAAMISFAWGGNYEVAGIVAISLAMITIGTIEVLAHIPDGQGRPGRPRREERGRLAPAPRVRRGRRRLAVADRHLAPRPQRLPALRLTRSSWTPRTSPGSRSSS